jgi:hypothetical protein
MMVSLPFAWEKIFHASNPYLCIAATSCLICMSHSSFDEVVCAVAVVSVPTRR